MEITIENFKHFALNNKFTDTLDYSNALTSTLDIDAEKLGMLLGEKYGTFYCPCPDSAKLFDFNSDDELNADIEKLMSSDHLERGINFTDEYNRVAHILHDSAECFDCGFFGSNDFIFVDLIKIKQNCRQ